MKKYLVAICAFLITSNTAFAAMLFPDVAEDHPNAESINYLKDRGIIQGYEDGMFLPDNPVNRVEALKIILLSAETDIDEELTSNFPDIPEDAWFYSFVSNAVSKEIAKGYDDGTFQPAAQINFVETLKIAINAFGHEVETEGAANWYEPYLNFALSKNIVLLDDNGEAYPDEVMTRASFSEILYRFAFMKEYELDSFPLSEDWEYYERALDYYKLKIPPMWEIREENTRTVLWRKTDGQLDYYRLTPKSAVLTIHKKDNTDALSKDGFFEMVEALNHQIFYPNEIVVENFDVGDIPVRSFSVATLNIKDYYAYLPNGKVLVLYAESGESPLKAQNFRFIEAAVKNLQFVDPGNPDVAAQKEELMQQINQNLLVEGVGLSIINSLPETSLFETDAIGVGTGPVDYYYSSFLNLTLKYERAGDVILNTRDEQTSKF
jgi:hypothetical protein